MEFRRVLFRSGTALDAVVSGGFLDVTGGNYAESVTVAKDVNMDVTGTASVNGLTTAAGTMLGLSGTLAVAGAVAVCGALALSDHVVLALNAATSAERRVGKARGRTGSTG